MGTIRTVPEFDAALSAGPYTSVGSYPVYFLAHDGECLCHKCAKDNAGEVRDAIAHNDRFNGFLVVGCEVNWESELSCAHCYEAIERAYPAEGGEETESADE
jgi:hypothetical protein